MSELRAPSEGTPSPSESVGRRRRWWQTASGISAAAAVLTVLVAALPVAIQLNWIGGPGSGATSPVVGTSSQSPPTIEFKSVQHETGALTVEVPADWEVAMSQGFGGVGTVKGIGMQASANLDDLYSWRNPQAFIGASKDLATLFRSTGASGALELLTAYIREFDWTLEQCRFERETPFSRGGYTGVYRVWQDCAQVGSAFWELLALTGNLQVVVHVQVRIPKDLDATTIVQQMLNTVEVREEKMPVTG